MNKKVVVYSSPVCPYCEMAKNYLKEKGVSFEEINVAVDQKAAQRMVQKTGQMGVPVIEIGDNFVIGFNQTQIDQLLNLQEKNK